MAASCASEKGLACGLSAGVSGSRRSICSSMPSTDSSLEEWSLATSSGTGSVAGATFVVRVVVRRAFLLRAERLRARPVWVWEVVVDGMAVAFRREIRSVLLPVMGRFSAWRRRRRTSDDREAKFSDSRVRGRPDVLLLLLRGRAMEDYKFWDDKPVFRAQQYKSRMRLWIFTGPFIARLMTEGKPMATNMPVNTRST